MIKPNIFEGIEGYFKHHIHPGGFLLAVLENDLMHAVGRADPENLEALPEIVRYCVNYLPADCWGSPAKVRAWAEGKRP